MQFYTPSGQEKQFYKTIIILYLFRIAMQVCHSIIKSQNIHQIFLNEYNVSVFNLIIRGNVYVKILVMKMPSFLSKILKTVLRIG